MGLDKRKPILLKNDFDIDPLYAQNAQLSIESKSTMPYLAQDVAIDKGQSTYYSVEYVLQKLLANDKFINEFMNRNTSQLSYVSKERLSSSIDQTNATISPDTSSIYANAYESHLDEFHGNGNATLVSVANDFMKVDMSNFDYDGAKKNFLECSPSATDIPTSQDAMQLSNDIVVNVEFSDQVRRPTNFVNALVCNRMTGMKFKSAIELDLDMMIQLPALTSTSYIYKEWLSGIKELYIHIPTTFTMYNENLHANDVDYYMHENVKDNATLLQVTINRRHFNLNNIYQAYICGQSFPLQIHNESNNLHYADVILPSMLKTLCVQPSGKSTNVECIYDDVQQTYTLYFVCYGTDEQAIKLFCD